MLRVMLVRRLHQRTRPFRYGGFWLLAVSLALVGGLMLSGAARTPAQLVAGVLFCTLWPWAADRLHALAPAGQASRIELAAYPAECALTALVLGWVSPPFLAAFALSLCLLAGATALAGWRLLLPSALALLAGGAAGNAASPDRTIASTAGADVVCLLLVLGFSLALAQISFRQAERLHGQRRNLAAKSAALERVNGRLERYLPPSLRARVTQAPDEPCGWERRWLTVAFVDLVGFTRLAERLEPELLARILDEYLGAFIPAAERRGGEVSKLLGDGMLVVFGMHEDGGRQRRVQAAADFCRALPEMLDALADEWRQRGEPVALRVRAGIASGFCTLGDRGGAERLDFTLIGPPVNLASRLQAHAGAGGVLLDEASAALAEPAHPLGAPRQLQVKGLGPVRAYPLLGEAAAVTAAALTKVK